MRKLKRYLKQNGATPVSKLASRFGWNMIDAAIHNSHRVDAQFVIDYDTEYHAAAVLRAI